MPSVSFFARLCDCSTGQVSGGWPQGGRLLGETCLARQTAHRAELDVKIPGILKPETFHLDPFISLCFQAPRLHLPDEVGRSLRGVRMRCGPSVRWRLGSSSRIWVSPSSRLPRFGHQGAGDGE